MEKQSVLPSRNQVEANLKTFLETELLFTDSEEDSQMWSFSIFNDEKSDESTNSIFKKDDHWNSNKLLTISDVARIWGVRKEIVKSFINDGKLGYIQIGKRKRIPLRELKRSIDENLKYDQHKKEEPKLTVIKPKYTPKGEPFDSRNLFNTILKEKNGNCN